MRRALRVGPASLLWRPRVAAYTGTGLILILVLGAVGLASGGFAIPAVRIPAVLFGDGDRRETVILGLRAPRVLLAIAVGAALGVAGAIVQATARNDLATPDLLGITGGASVGAVAVIVLADRHPGAAAVGVPVAATLGGLAAAVLVLLILRRTGFGGLSPVLVGIGVSAMLGGLVSWLLIVADVDDLARAQVWLTGTLNLRSWPELTAVAATLGVCLIGIVPLSGRLASLSLGPDVARGLGVRVGAVQAGLLLIAVLLSSAVTAAAGPIGFVSLVAPHLARFACGTPTAGLVPAAVTGAALTLAADVAARTLFPVQLPTGAVTALIGAPFLLWLLVRARKDLR